MKLNKKRQKTLDEIFENPIRSDIVWTDIEKLIIALGGDKSEGRGSRVRFKLNEIKAIFHRPHPKSTTNKGTIKSVRKFLINAEIK